MKITYELDSHDPDDRDDIEMLHNARRYRRFLWDIDQRIRSWQKHGDDGKYETAAKLLDDVRNMVTDSGAREVS